MWIWEQKVVKGRTIKEWERRNREGKEKAGVWGRGGIGDLEFYLKENDDVPSWIVKACRKRKR